MTPWCDDVVCSWRRLLADRHSLPFPWTLSLHRRWCPSASHHPLTFLFLLSLTFPLPSPFPSLGLSLCGPQCPSASPHSFPSHSLGRLCQRSPRTCPVSLLREGGGGADLLLTDDCLKNTPCIVTGTWKPCMISKAACTWFDLEKGVRPNSGELSEGVGGTFGRLTMFNTATYQEPLDCNHSKAHNFRNEWWLLVTHPVLTLLSPDHPLWP